MRMSEKRRGMTIKIRQTIAGNACMKTGANADLALCYPIALAMAKAAAEAKPPIIFGNLGQLFRRKILKTA